MSDKMDYMHNYINDIVKKITTEKDDFVFAQFERHGYERQEVLNLLQEHRISVTEHSAVNDYFVDEMLLFSISIIQDNTNVKMTCHDVKRR